MVTGHLETARDAAVDEDLYADGRVALYAKGQIAGKWLATIAYDSARDPQVGTSLFAIDPQTYFTLYGDASQQGYDAASSRKIYLKMSASSSTRCSAVPTRADRPPSFPATAGG